MANPQKEDGYTAIANEIMEALCKANIPGEEHRVLTAILRKTYGWNKCQDEISMGQLAEMTDLKRPNVARALKGLLSKKITLVIENDNTDTNTLKFNKNYDQWVLSKRITAKRQGVIKKDNRGVIKKRKKVLSEKIPTKDIYTKDILKDKGIDILVWQKFVEMRIKIKKPATEYALELIIGKLEKIKTQHGHDPNEVLKASIVSNWQDVYPLKPGHEPIAESRWFK